MPNINCPMPKVKARTTNEAQSPSGAVARAKWLCSVKRLLARVHPLQTAKGRPPAESRQHSPDISPQSHAPRMNTDTHRWGQRFCICVHPCSSAVGSAAISAHFAFSARYSWFPLSAISVICEICVDCAVLFALPRSPSNAERRPRRTALEKLQWYIPPFRRRVDPAMSISAEYLISPDAAATNPAIFPPTFFAAAIHPELPRSSLASFSSSRVRCLRDNVAISSSRRGGNHSSMTRMAGHREWIF